MPGFGNGPFGNFPFGHFPWSKTLLYDYVPELHRVQDEANDFALEKWAQSQQPSYDGLLSRIYEFDTLRDPRYVRTQYSEVHKASLGAEVLVKPKIEQRGIDGAINSFREFSAGSVRFSEEDTGKVLALSRSSVAANSIEYVIARVLSPTSAVLDPMPAGQDTGADRWEVRIKTTRKEGVVTLQVRDGDMARIAPGYLLNDGFADYTVIGRRLFERSEDLRHLTVREGADGSIDAFGRFVSPTLGALPTDEWRYLFIDGVDPEAPKRVIEHVVPSLAGTTVEIGGDTLPQNAGPLVWALLSFPEIDLAASALPKGAIEQEGTDLSVIATDGFSSPSLRLTADDEGKFLTIRGAVVDLGNNCTVRIQTVTSPTSGTIDTAFGEGLFVVFVSESSLAWELRSATSVATRSDEAHYLAGDFGDDPSPSYGVTIRASSLITEFTKDFGIATDEQETERRQRNWVRHVTQWLDKKGTAGAYTTLNRISGVEGVVAALFSATQSVASTLDFDAVYLMASPDPSSPRVCTDGSLTTIAGDVFFSTLSITFTGGDAERYITISDSTLSANNGTYEIAEVIDTHTVRLWDRAPHLFTQVPDLENGALGGAVVSYYTTTLPAYVLGDDVNVDLLTEIVGYALDPGPGSAIVEGSGFSLSDGTVAIDLYEYDSNSSVTPGKIAVPYTAGMTAVQVAASVLATINTSGTVQLTAFQKSGRRSVSLAHRLGGSTISGSGASWTPTSGFAGFFYPDYVCSQPHFSARSPVYIIGVTQLSLFSYQVEVIGTAAFNDSPEVVITTGNWFVTDASSVAFYLETVPAAAGTDGTSGRPKYSFTVSATAAPVTSRVTEVALDYRCEVKLSCDYCATYKIGVTLTEGTELFLEGAVARENDLARAQARMLEAKPAHVQFVPLVHEEDPD